MKKMGIAVLVLISVLWYGYSAKARYHESEVISICRSYAVQEGISLENLELYESSAQAYIINTRGMITEKWLVTFEEKGSSDSAFVFIIFNSCPGIIQTSNKARSVYELERQRLEWEAQKGLYMFWSVEDKAKFNREVNTPLGLQGGAMLPAEGDIGEELALEMARSGVQEKFALSASQMDAFLVDISFLTVNGKTSWAICYRFNDQDRQIPFQIAYAAVITAETGEMADLISYSDEW